MSKKNKSLYNQIFACFDIETTGLNPFTDHILELGAVQFSFGKGLISSFSSLVSFQGNIPQEAIQIHGITSKTLQGAPCLKTVLQQFLQFIHHNTYLIAHNSQFDTYFIAFQLQKLKLNYPKNPVFDTWSLAKNLCPELKSYRLQDLKKYLALGNHTAHRALGDSETTMRLFDSLMKDFYHLSVQDFKKFNPPIFFSKFHNQLTKMDEQKLNLIQKAKKTHQRLLLHYKNRSGKEDKRSVQPEAIKIIGGHVCLVAYCFLREDHRDFRFDRIKNLVILS